MYLIISQGMICCRCRDCSARLRGAASAEQFEEAVGIGTWWCWRFGHYPALCLKCLPPGNVRELGNVIERAVILSSDRELKVPVAELSRFALVSDNWKPQTLEEAERAHILATLKKTRWVLAGPNGAAMRLGLNRSTLQFRMKKLGIMRPSL
jgi:Bacterial regulatory protein, Fis family